MSKLMCKKCGHENSEQLIFCNLCGESLIESQVGKTVTAQQNYYNVQQPMQQIHQQPTYQQQIHQQPMYQQPTYQQPTYQQQIHQQPMYQQPTYQQQMYQQSYGTTYAGFWIRLAAYLIDGVILFVGQFILFFIFGMLYYFIMALFSYNSTIYSIMDVFEAGRTLISVLFAWLYFSLFESSKLMGTPGKKALGIVVVDQNFNRISFGRATGRYFSKLISGMILCIGYIMAAFSDRKQALHDLIAGTYCVKR